MGNQNTFLDEIRSTVLIGDGAIGTELFARGASLNTGVERLNLLAPDMVLELHKDYVAAGSRVIETNTFGANRLNLEKYGAGHEARDIIAAGVKLARKAAGKNIYVAGSVGPLPLIEGEPLSDSEQDSLFSDQITALQESGVDLLIFETFIDLNQLLRALALARSLTGIPIIAQMAFESGGRTASGDSAEQFLQSCIKAGADVVGANCGSGVQSVVDAIGTIAPFGIPMSAYMNAGFAERIEDRFIYIAPHDYLAKKAAELVHSGVRLVGGCCGTGPDTIRAIVKALSEGKYVVPAPIHVEARPATGIEALPEPAVSKIPAPPHGILVELDPPKRPDISALLKSAETLKKAGVQAFTLADNPLASVRVDVLTAAGALMQKTGMPVIPHLTGRDRNRIGLQSTILGAHVLGIRSLLCVTGDPIRMYHETNTSGVFDVTSIGLVKLVSEFNSGQRLNEQGHTSFSIGVALNPNVRSIDGQIGKLRRKIDAGAHFVLTQPIFDIERLDTLQDALDKAHIHIPVYIGLMPLKSSGQADYLHFEVPGIYIPDTIRERLGRYTEPADQQTEGIAIARELVERMAPRVYGLYLISSMNRAEPLLPVIESIQSHAVWGKEISK
ncbi:bifunctional homocysteine S-methyltransferase/methylenetetrahydrofolate reductase [bacterium]|nr:bifunctional homocysteine S-methyltransferase/methylenetetrahydrofolate reductase [bacterium]